MIRSVTDKALKRQIPEEILMRHHFEFPHFSGIVIHDLINTKNRNAIEQDKGIIPKQHIVVVVKREEVKLVLSLSHHYPGNIFTHDFFHRRKTRELIEEILFIRLTIKWDTVHQRSMESYVFFKENILKLHVEAPVVKGRSQSIGEVEFRKPVAGKNGRVRVDYFKPEGRINFGVG